MGYEKLHRLRALRSWRLEFVDGPSDKDIFGVDVVHRYVLDGLSRRVRVVITREMDWFAEHFTHDATLERDHISLLHTFLFQVAWNRTILNLHFEVVLFSLSVWTALSELLFVVLVNAAFALLLLLHVCDLAVSHISLILVLNLLISQEAIYQV